MDFRFLIEEAVRIILINEKAMCKLRRNFLFCKNGKYPDLIKLKLLTFTSIFIIENRYLNLSIHNWISGHFILFQILRHQNLNYFTTKIQLSIWECDCPLYLGFRLTPHSPTSPQYPSHVVDKETISTCGVRMECIRTWVTSGKCFTFENN